MTIDLRNLEVSTYPDRGQGGQHVGLTQSGVKITHPIGVTVIVETHRSQHKNKEVAMDAMLSALTHPGMPS